MGRFIINFICMSIAVWIVFSMMGALFFIAVPFYHWPVGLLFTFSFLAAGFDTLCEGR